MIFMHMQYHKIALSPLAHSICGIAGENRPTGAKFPMKIIDL